MKYLLIICLFLSSCARVPIQSVELSEALREETERMHRINLALVDKLLHEKVYQVNEFIIKEYTPQFIENFKAGVEKKFPGTDFKADFKDLMLAAYPQINATKDSMVYVLQQQKALVVDKLNADYAAFTAAYLEMQNLLRSAAKVNEKRTEVFQQIKTLTKNRVDLESVDAAINKFIRTGGDIGAKTVELTNTINKLLKNN
jgi:hypothetical protein